MLRRCFTAVVVGVAALGWWAGSATPAMAQQPGYILNHFYYYPYYYFPHNYWPAQSPKWPEPIGAHYMPPPAYMAYPPFVEPNWRYEFWSPQKYYRGFHFWLDQF
jgi:hypothetical protein